MSVSSEIERIQNGVSEQTELISQIRTTLSSKTSLPTTLPNPYPLIFSGAVTGNYDGSATVTIDIPDLNTKVNRTTAVNEADANYTTLMARGEKLLPKADFDSVTDWSQHLVNGAIAWGYE